MEETLINRDENSGLITFNLEDHYPQWEVAQFDIKDYLFQGLILREKDFRLALKEHDWNQYHDKVLCVFCSSDAIIPIWAYMLVASHAKEFAKEIFTGTPQEFLSAYYHKIISTIDTSTFKDQRVVIKGCSDKPVPVSAYADIVVMLHGVAQSIMFGEPCSTVPVFKRPRVL